MFWFHSLFFFWACKKFTPHSLHCLQVLLAVMSSFFFLVSFCVCSRVQSSFKGAARKKKTIWSLQSRTASARITNHWLHTGPALPRVKVRGAAVCLAFPSLICLPWLCFHAASSLWAVAFLYACQGCHILCSPLPPAGPACWDLQHEEGGQAAGGCASCLRSVPLGKLLLWPGKE